MDRFYFSIFIQPYKATAINHILHSEHIHRVIAANKRIALYVLRVLNMFFELKFLLFHELLIITPNKVAKKHLRCRAGKARFP